MTITTLCLVLLHERRALNSLFAVIVFAIGTSGKNRLFPPWILESHGLVTGTHGEQGSTTLFNPSAGIQNYYINHDLRMPASNSTICFWWKFDSRLYGTMVSIAQEGKQKQSICCENMLRFIYTTIAMRNDVIGVNDYAFQLLE